MHCCIAPNIVAAIAFAINARSIRVRSVQAAASLRVPYIFMRTLYGLVITCLLCCQGCTQVAFFAANASASFGAYSRQSDVSYGTHERNQLDIYIPNHLRDSTGTAPVVVFFHGGGWNSGAKSYYKFVAAALAEHGYVVVVPNYRLYPQVTAPEIYVDPAAAVAWTLKHAQEWHGDSKRVYLLGHSAGAHLAMMLALNSQYLEHAGSSPNRLHGVIGLAGPYDFLPFSRGYMNELFGPPAQFAASQPINFVRRDAPPLLLMHGLHDTTVAPKNTRNLTAAMQALNACVHAEYFDAADHGDLVAAFSSLKRHPVPVLPTITKWIDDDAVCGNESAEATYNRALSRDERGHQTSTFTAAD